MSEFKFKVVETLSRDVTVTAENKEDAFDIVSQMYRQEDIVLDAADLCWHEILDAEEVADV